MKIIGGYLKDGVYIIQLKRDDGGHVKLTVRPIDFGMDPDTKEYIQVSLLGHQLVVRMIGGTNSLIIDPERSD